MDISTNVQNNCYWAVKKINDTCEIAMQKNDMDMLDDAHSIYEEFLEWIDESESISDTYVMYLHNLNV